MHWLIHDYCLRGRLTFWFHGAYYVHEYLLANYGVAQTALTVVCCYSCFIYYRPNSGADPENFGEGDTVLN